MTPPYGVSRAGETFALRIFPVGEDAVCAREVAVVEWAGEHGIPVPRVRAVATWQGRSAQLLTWCAGNTLKELLETQPWQAERLGALFGETLAAIHRVLAPDTLPRVERWLDWKAPVDPALARTLRRLESSAPVLVHLDYHPLNVLSDGTRITGVLDWVNARAGDLRADLARTVTILRLDACPPGRRGKGPCAVLHRFERGWRARYERIAGPASDLAPFYAWAGTAMERDLAHKRPPECLARVRAWTRHWQARTGRMC